MKPRKITQRVTWMGAIDWDRRLFDSLIPLPDGTSYNSYLIEGGGKRVLVDTVDPPMSEVLLSQLENVPSLDYVIAHHAEQDHAGSIPHVLEKYPQAKVIATPKGKELLMEHLLIPAERFRTIEDGERISLGDRTLRFFHTPWVHWPETMVTYLEEERILFTCDFFGSHLATTDLYVNDRQSFERAGRVYEAAKRYYAEIMMPFRKIIRKNIEKIEKLDIRLIAPSHGPCYDNPDFILDAYRDWISETPGNEVVVAYISMHGSTRKMVEHLVNSLAARGIRVHQFDLAVADIGKLAITLVDAATLVVGTPTIHTGPHPNVVYAAYLANCLRPKLKFATVIGSYGWNTRAVDQVAGMIPNLNVEVLNPVLIKGCPEEKAFASLDELAETILKKHREADLAPTN